MSKDMDRRYRTYSLVLSAAISLAAMFAISGCGEDYLVSESSLPKLNQHIFVLPDRFAGQPYTYTAPVSSIYLDTSETIKFWAAYSLDGAYISSDSADNHYLNHSWTIDGDEYNISPLRFSFNTPGYHQGILQTVDLLDDTLRDTLDIYVNTPIKITLIAPINGYNQVKPNSDSEVEIRWALSGLDPWEASSCHIFASFKPKEVWENDLGSVDCNETARFVGSFLPDSLQEYLDEHPEVDTSVTLFWGMKAAFYTKDGFRETDSTEIFQLSTLLLHEESSVINIPVTYEDNRNKDVRMRVTITDNLGDTLYVYDGIVVPTTVVAKVAPQTRLHIYVNELKRKEFQPESVFVSTAPGTRTVLDTIRLQDKIQPQVSPRSVIDINRDINIGSIEGDSTYFYALDNGAGINPNKIVVIADSDTISHVYEEPYIKFKTPCKDTCKVRVSVEDYAHNSSPRLYWKYVHDKYEPTYYGPFTDLGVDL